MGHSEHTSAQEDREKLSKNLPQEDILGGKSEKLNEAYKFSKYLFQSNTDIILQRKCI